MEVNQITGEFQFDLWVKTPIIPKTPVIKTSNRFGALQSVDEDEPVANQDSSFRRPAADPL